MSIHKKLAKLIQTIFRQVVRISKTLTNNLMKWLLRSFLVSGRKANLSSAGFVLPTIIMVMLVVILLTTAILFRSFDRTKNISNYRVSQQVLNAALPALDRAKAKIGALLDNQTTRGTPNDTALDNELIQPKYNLLDETRLQVTYTPGGSANDLAQGFGSAQYAWRFPVDTDNNGKFDSLSLYSILFRAPDANTNGNDTRKRTPLEARTQPMQQNIQGNSACEAAAGTSAALTGNQGWYKVGSQLKRSFFVYVATVPITNVAQPGIIPPPPTGVSPIPEISRPNNYETYKGNKGFSALEFQQDKGKLSVSNNAILYEDDLEISPGGNITVNGRIMTNSNLFVSVPNDINLRQVSSRASCFYEAINGKIVVGGNVAYGSPSQNSTTNSTAADVDLFQGTRDANDPQADQPLNTTNVSVTDPPNQVGYNSQAYEARINKLVETAIANDPTGDNDPTEVTQGITQQISRVPGLSQQQARQDQLDRYLRARTRRVPYKEVPFSVPYDPSTDPLYASLTVTGTGEDLQPSPEQVMFPFNPTDGSTESGYGELALKTTGNKLEPSATKFSIQENDTTGKESLMGDRLLVGNNLPQNWLKDAKWVSSETEQPINGITWDDAASAGETRSRKTRVALLGDVADTRRNGFWEVNAQKQPTLASDGFGGLRVVTGSGIYLPPRQTPLTSASKVVWPDTMPVIPSPAVLAVGQQYNQPVPPWLGLDFPGEVGNATSYRPYLQMRATAVYHYTYRDGKKPIACVSSYYDPTDKDTARNILYPTKLPDVSGDPSLGARDSTTYNLYKSNNGVTYPPPNISESSVRPILNYQTQLVYPNGRPVNQLLKNALQSYNPQNRSLAEQAAVDSALCALQILGTSGVPPLTPSDTPTPNYPLPHGTIKEVAFLDARQIKAIDGNPSTDTNPTTGQVYTDYKPTGQYNLAIEQRQPLEVRATVLNLDNLRQAQTRNAPYGKPEYMLPNSGIIYATRDDALADATASNQVVGNADYAPVYSDANDDATDAAGKQVLKLSSNDFLLDPTRRPNGIMLTNGERLFRQLSYRDEEKGMILASNLPVYIKADPVSGLNPLKGGFNLHRKGGGGGGTGGPLVEEFTQLLAATDFYDRTTLDPDFACRSGDPRIPCPSGDQWRPATIIGDAVTLLSYDPSSPSSGFKEGYRSDGDYDLRNNQIDNIPNPEVVITPDADDVSDGGTIEWKRLEQGFFNNNFVTTHTFTDSAYSGTTPTAETINSSYFNNAVTPVQRRGEFSEYLMEMCDKRLVSECTAPTDWYIGTVSGVKLRASSVINRAFVPTDIVTFKAGTTAQFLASASNPDLAKLPRRVAFARDLSNNLILDSDGRPYPLGIDNTTGSDQVACYSYATSPVPITVPRPGRTGGKKGGQVRSVPCKSFASSLPKQSPNALWFATTTNLNDPTVVDNYGYDYPLAYLNGTSSSLPTLSASNQPLLVPVLQLQNSGTTIVPGPDVANVIDTTQTKTTNWLPRAAGDTTFNLIMAVGDNPSHPPANINGTPHAGDFNGGFQNLPRFLENWTNTSGATYNANISGSFIQIKRSYYATAPNTQLPVMRSGFPFYPRTEPFNYPQGYPTGNTEGRAPYYERPTRTWGFDVGLLSQVPDLFSNQFVLPNPGKPNEFFREVARSDEWVETLMCAKALDRNGIVRGPALNVDQRPAQFCNQTGG